MDSYAGLTSGTLLEGRYRVGALIARGGMSMVYRGVDTRLDRAVAIKVMSPQYLADPAFLARFEREARLAASLGHPGVVAVYDQGRDGDLAFLVMELVDGGTLRELLRERGALPVPVAVCILEPLLAALGAAHSAGLVHRDVKPENVLISATGAVKIADFGLVRAVSSQTVATGNVILGTVAYLSPEQVATGAADARSDVYSAGIVGYEMLTGRPPFDGDNPMSVAYQHVHSDVPRPSRAAPGVPDSLDDLITAATSRDTAARPRDASAFLRALVVVRSGLGLPQVAVPVPQHRPAALAAPRVVAPVGAPTRLAVPQGPTGTRMLDPGVPPTRVEPVPSQAAQVRTPERTEPGHSPSHSTRLESAEDPTRALRRLRRRRWLIAILVVLLLGLAAAAGGWWLGGRWAATPASVGLAQSDAEALVREAGLVPIVTIDHSDDVPPGVVARSEPDPGSRQLRGSQVDLLVSSGHPQVPTIRAGTDVATASGVVRDADLTPVVGTTPAFDEVVPVGSMLRTDPPVGTQLSVGAPVTLVLSAGPEPLVVPDVAGKSGEDAQNKLVVSGFILAPATRVFRPDVDPGSVLGTDPAAGSTAARGSPVSLRIAVALTVPDVRGKSTADAVDLLDRAGYTVTVGDPAFDPGYDRGEILRTDPGPATKVDPQNPRIFLVPSNAVTVPDVVGGSVGQAGRTLAGLGLQMQVSALFGHDDARVWDQSPGAGGRVSPGGTVVITAFP